MDLAEQHLMECCSFGGCGNGCDAIFTDFNAAQFVAEHGVMEEAAFPYAGSNAPTCADSIGIPKETLRFSGRYFFEGNTITEDSLKQIIIKRGPLATGITRIGHGMALIGYRTQNGKIIWIFKDGQGLGSGNRGFVEIDFSKNDFRMTYYIIPVKSRRYADKDIRCVDLDHDGYYNWGIGPKPATCPGGCPNECDCDDSRNNLGPYLADGSCKPISVDIQFINQPNSEIFHISGPNPLTKYTTINLKAPGGTRTGINIHDMSGGIIRKFVLDQSHDGAQQVVWDGTNQSGKLISNGIYVCKIKMNTPTLKITKIIKLYISR